MVNKKITRDLKCVITIHCEMSVSEILINATKQYIFNFVNEVKISNKLQFLPRMKWLCCAETAVKRQQSMSENRNGIF